MNEIQIKQMDGQAVMDSRDVAEMMDKNHAHLMRDIARYINDLKMDPKLDSSKFFIKSTYVDSMNREKPCYLLTKQGCEFVANKMTGKKGTLFTARYVSLFNEYQEQQQKLEHHLTAEEITLEREKLANSNRWAAIREQDAETKAKAERRKNAEVWLHLADLAENEYDNPSMAMDLRNEAIRTLLVSPSLSNQTYTASQIAMEIGVTAYRIGYWAQRLGLKRQPTAYKRSGKWFYSAAARQELLKHKAEIQDEQYSEDAANDDLWGMQTWLHDEQKRITLWCATRRTLRTRSGHLTH